MKLEKTELEDFVEKRNSRIIGSIILLLSCLLLTAGILMVSKFGIDVDARDTKKKDFMFEEVGFGITSTDRVVYDKATKVMYMRYCDSYTLLVNPDGTPRIYEEDTTE